MIDVDGIVFDKDGTLIHFDSTWTPVFKDSAQHLSAQIGQPEKALQWLEAVGLCPETGKILPGTQLASGTTDVVAAAWREISPTLPPLEELIPWLDTYWAEKALEILEPVGNPPELFDELRSRSLKLAIATNDSEAAANETAKAIGIHHLLDALYGYDSGHGAKPWPGMILNFAERTGLSPSRLAMVGDSPADMGAGRAAGCGLVIAVLTGASPKEELEKLADLVIEDITEIPRYLTR